MIPIFNAYSGEIYEIKDVELKNIQEGEIPLKKHPRSSCKKCYGRGYIGFVGLHHMYKPCLQCVEKDVLLGYEKTLHFNYIRFDKSSKSI
jgi:hypothetical protein